MSFELQAAIGASIILALLFGWLYWDKQRIEREQTALEGYGAGSMQSKQPTTTNDYTSEAGVYPRQALPAAQDRPAVPAAIGGGAIEDTYLARLFTGAQPREREHTFIAAKTGDGKTQTAIAMMVCDILQGAQVFWCNPQPCYYHPEDQPTDLRPIAHLFTLVQDYGEILRTLQAVYAAADARKPLYQAGQDVGHAIVVYLEEWPAIFLAFASEPELKPYAKDLMAMLARIVRECRKLNVWLVVAAQDAQVQTTGIHTGLIKNFTTRLAGNVDTTTWGYVVGQGVKCFPVRKGTWMTEKGLIEVVRPRNEFIARMARLAPRPFAPLALAPADTADNSSWLDGTLEPVSGIEDGFLPLATLNTANTGPIPGQNTAANTGLKLTKGREQAIRAAADKGLSRSVMAGLIGGSKDDALALIASVLGPAGAENALQVEEVERV